MPKSGLLRHRESATARSVRQSLSTRTVGSRAMQHFHIGACYANPESKMPVPARVTMVTPRIVYIPRLYRAACAFLFPMRFCPGIFACSPELWTSEVRQVRGGDLKRPT